MLPQSGLRDEEVGEAEEDACLINSVSGDILVIVTKSDRGKKFTTNEIPFGNVSDSLEKAPRESSLALTYALGLTLMYQFLALLVSLTLGTSCRDMQ